MSKRTDIPRAARPTSLNNYLSWIPDRCFIVSGRIAAAAAIGGRDAATGAAPGVAGDAGVHGISGEKSSV